MPCSTPAITIVFTQGRVALLLRVHLILTNVARVLERRVVRVALPAAVSVLISLSFVAAYAAPPDPRSAPDRSEMDVIVLVLPGSQDTAHIAVAYKHKIDRAIVVRDAGKLAATIGGSVSDIQTDDESAHPDDLKHYPVNTAATFTLSGCKQTKGSAPDLHSYLVGFQSWTHIEVVFAVPTISGYSGVVQFDSPELAVTLIKEQDDYRYDAEIREHKKDLPALPENQTGAAVTSDSAPQHATDSAQPLSTVKSEGMSVSLLSGWICGAIILTFLAMYVLRYRRNTVETGRTGRT